MEDLLPEHRKFDKIYRYTTQKIIVTEKIDGTNGLIYIDLDNDIVKAGSRNRWIEIGDDNYGFAGWVEENREDLKSLGDGWHYGEWWGLGIQRVYNMDRKVFSLFNPGRWNNNLDKPICCDVVPVLFMGTPEDYNAHTWEMDSTAAMCYQKRFHRIEGHVLWFAGTQKYMKNIFDK